MMDVDTDTTQQSGYTILRIKRKRTDEPLDALVVDPGDRRKKSKGGAGIFQFAETVEEKAWTDEQEKKALQARISTLTRQVTPASEEIPPGQPKVAPKPLPADAASRRYTVVKQDLPERIRPRAPTAPPKVYSTKELREAREAFTVYDAIPSSEDVQPTPRDEEMDKFLPMLQEYLKVNDEISPPAKSSGANPSAVISGQNALKIPPPDDYVWDVFYHRPTTSSEKAELVNIGTLTGLPPSLNDPYGSDSDSEPEDEEDEDSNAEDWYKNDYPEEEESDADDSEYGSDVFHDGSEHDDLANDDGLEPHDWR